MRNRGRGGPPQFGFNPRMRGRGGPMMGGPRGPGGFGGPGPRQWGAGFARMGQPGGPGGMNAVPPPGHPMARQMQQWQAMGWNGGNGGGDFQDDFGGAQGGMGFNTATEGPNFAEGGPGPGPVPMHLVSPDNVKDWLTRQHPNVVKDIQMHSQFLLDKMGFSEGDVPPGPGGPPQGDGDEFASDEVVNPSWFAPVKPMNNQGPPAKKGKKHPGLGFAGNVAPSKQQWTPGGWVVKDNSHKVTTMMKPLPKIQIVPPMSTTYPDASMDNDKLKMLENNVNMMTAELTKICKLFKISNLNKDDLSQYPEGQQEKLKTALTCVGNAETTLDNYKDFLKTEKYKEWNDQQTEKRDEHVKSMIGETPAGVPHKRPAAAIEDEEEENGGEEEDE